MPTRRRFIQTTAAAASALPVLSVLGCNSSPTQYPVPMTDLQPNLIGAYGPWAAAMVDKVPTLSFRQPHATDLEAWRKTARNRLFERLAQPATSGTPAVTTLKSYSYDGLHIEELQWQLPYGPPTKAILLKPEGATGKLPGVLAFHDHGGNKYFGHRKITRTGAEQHPMMEEHQRLYYSGRAWANDLARRGYVVLVSDAFPFESRRVLLTDVPTDQRDGLNESDPENPTHIDAYNRWAGNHEHIMSKSLLSAGTTWAGVFLAEDQRALDVLCARPDVDDKRIGCCGLSGGGMRTAFIGGADPRITCAVCVGFMTTWKDLVLHKSVTHTWMTYVPLLPNELDFPEILGIRAPLPTLVLNDRDDELYTLPEMQRADQILKDVYAKAKAPEHYRCSFHPGPHKFDAPMQAEAFEWLDRWLVKH